jgi:hypothetical protein
VQTPERIGMAVLLENLTGSAELVKVRQTLCRVGNSSNIPNGILIRRFDWLSVRTKLIKLYNKFGMVTDYSFIKLTVGGKGTDNLASDKVNLRITFAV